MGLHPISRKLIPHTCLLICLASVLLACNPSPDVPTATPFIQELRVENIGTQDLVGLTVRFPGPSAVSPTRQIAFGDVAAGATTAYQPVPSGVYRYAAYSYTLDGRTIDQYVIDWLGETPMAGQLFTYQLRLDPTKVPGDQIELVRVAIDTP